MDDWLQANLVCPRDRGELRQDGDILLCAAGHRYPVVAGVPVMVRDDVQQTLWVANRSLEISRQKRPVPPEVECSPPAEIDQHVQDIVASTCGHLYAPLVNSLPRYPIPDLRLPDGNGQRILDIGCNWGRWCVAAARKGYTPVGIDPALDAVLSARRVSRQLGVEAIFVVGDARYLPFRAQSFEMAFSYSVLQHFSKENARLALLEIARVLKPAGKSLVQMPNRWGIRCLYHQARRGFREPVDFEVRYWTLAELQETFTSLIGQSNLSVDGFFGLGIQSSDVDLLPRRFQWVVRSSELLRALARRRHWLQRFADSIYVESRRDG